MSYRRCAALAAFSLLFVTAGGSAEACNGLRSSGNSANGSMRPNRVNVSLTVKNTGTESCRVFAFQDTTAIDNAGNNWLAHAVTYAVAGVFVCDRHPYCLNKENEKFIENSATVIEPGQSAPVTLSYSGTESDRKFGDLVTVGFVLMAQTIKEQATPSGVQIVGGPWRSVSVGAANIPFRSN